NKSHRIAISGAPGAGKSTFINAFGSLLLDNNYSLAVLAVDPSSSISKGSILGDKTRMEDLVRYKNCFIRPTASSSNLGGVARSTRETILLCEAFGFDYIFVETVGVGQSETLVKNMTDLFLLLLLPNSGDELQGIKRGIMEMADIILINKSDGDHATTAKIAATQVKHALHLFSENEKNWPTQVLNISSVEQSGFIELQKAIDGYFLKMETSGFHLHNRNQQDLLWFESSLIDELQIAFANHPNIQKEKQDLILKIKKQEISVQQAAKFLVQKHLK
ncbi:MAG TPA: methylmalonyl Co-A mutase-associated GTPase MeaB, partial [Chitinophagales bacterium]|nr:methylmalonyl Co-A mutase-associated GTPase MeaB [Chitinophagales bacterium]